MYIVVTATITTTAAAATKLQSLLDTNLLPEQAREKESAIQGRHFSLPAPFHQQIKGG